MLQSVIQDRGVGGNQEHEVQGGERGREVAGLVALIAFQVASEKKLGGHIKMSLQDSYYATFLLKLKDISSHSRKPDPTVVYKRRPYPKILPEYRGQKRVLTFKL